MDSLTAANNKFCFDFFREISKDDAHKNIFVCPLSLSAAFGMVRLGARGDSAHQIDEALHFNELSRMNTKNPMIPLHKVKAKLLTALWKGRNKHQLLRISRVNLQMTINCLAATLGNFSPE
uniref:Serpin domain-containing protein n=1 Tax=Mus musculus TaxID=10090 RepID=Q9D629_MOUSE|nr:unnamed protein product [Mus musculus]